MRRLTSLTAFVLLAALLPMHSANADTRDGPPIDIQLYLFINETEDPPTQTGSLDVSGTECLPKDDPASVIVTLDRAPGQVFTAKPNVNGRWYVSIPIEVPIDGVYVVNAECDNYFGTTIYPTATTNSDDVITGAVAASGGSGGGPSAPMTSPTPTPSVTVVTDPVCAFTNSCIANTGTRTSAELSVGVAALVVGLLLVLAGRPRRATRLATNDDVGRHRRSH